MIVSMASKMNMDEYVILDSASTFSLFKSHDKVVNLRKAPGSMVMMTNAGSKTLDMAADVPGFGPVWFDKEAVANILGLADLTKTHRIVYDSDLGDAFHATHRTSGEKCVFTRSPEGLYVTTFSKGYIEFCKKQNSDLGQQHLETVKNNASGYSSRELHRARRARELYHILSTPSLDSFKSIIKSNMIRNCPVTIQDINLADRIFGPSISALKGKSTRTTPKAVVDDTIELPPEIAYIDRSVELCMDTMFINGLPMLTTIDKTIRFRTLTALVSRSHSHYMQAIKIVVRRYNDANIKISVIHGDGEYRAMFDEIKHHFAITFNCANPGDHVPEAERNNRTIAERFRANFHRLPFTALPSLMIRQLAMRVTSMLNMFPAKGGISPYYSPQQIITKRTLDYNRDCRYEFGAYVQANQHNEPTNSNEPRTIDAIYLRPTMNQQGGHELMDLHTGHLITRSKVTVLPITASAIARVDELGFAQGFKKLVFKNRHGIYLPDADWIAGVDYAPPNVYDEQDDANDDEYHEEDNEDDDDYEEEIDPNEIADLLYEGREQQPNPNVANEPDDIEPAGVDEDPAMQPEANAHDTGNEQPAVEVRRSSRTRGEVERLNIRDTSARSYAQLEAKHNIFSQVLPDPEQNVEYNEVTGLLAARIIHDLNQKIGKGASFGQQYMLNKALKIFGDKARQGAKEEIGQLHDRACFTPISVAKMSNIEKQRAQRALMFVTEKRDGRIKGRMVFDGSRTREWLSKEDAASPTASLESIFLTSVIEAQEGRDVMTADVPNAFIQASMPEVKEGEERVMMKITGVLVDMLVELDPSLYAKFVVFEDGEKVLYVQVLRAIYGMLVAALLWYKKFRGDLEKEGFVFNPYDPCVANRDVDGTQQTVLFHVDDLKSSHLQAKVNDTFYEWLQKMYGEHKAVTATRGKKHDYLGMTLDYSVPGKVKIDMCRYVQDMLDDFPVKFKDRDTATTPAGEDLFNQKGVKGQKLDKKMSEQFHTTVAKGLFLSKRARPDIQPTIAYLCTKVLEPTTVEWKQLVRLMKYLNGTKEKVLTLKADNMRVIKWFVDASFAVHADFKSHTGAVMTLGGGAVQSISRKQKLNTKSSTEAELVGADDAAVMILWTKLFMEAQGYNVDNNILYQDNKSAILLEVNGQQSAGRRSRALNVRYFFLTDQVEKGNLTVEYCPTDLMVGDFMTKPLQGEKFIQFRKAILGED